MSGSDRDALERLCRYVNRPAVAMSRLERRPDGLIACQLRRAYTDGTTSFVFSEGELAKGKKAGG